MDYGSAATGNIQSYTIKFHQKLTKPELNKGNNNRNAKEGGVRTTGIKHTQRTTGN